MGKCLFMRKGETHTVPGRKTITFSVTDGYDALSALLSVSSLTVDSTAITGASMQYTTKNQTVVITFKLNSTISVARTVVVNGVTLGTVQQSGASVSTTIPVVHNQLITISFNK